MTYRYPEQPATVSRMSEYRRRCRGRVVHAAFPIPGGNRLCPAGTAPHPTIIAHLRSAAGVALPSPSVPSPSVPCRCCRKQLHTVLRHPNEARSPSAVMLVVPFSNHCLISYPPSRALLISSQVRSCP
ncbi:hypothetical protein BKA67DRAFT_113495 [Truncatella angustata]|uniref:Uncharacterized protein n=1 Tax=Truncatella angustata TaxID=152316 RepID=A0A9P8U8S2_9PEZI|nr:uncharacterized protein BKA67DRAFT_113495 [Truncatella angustata]KAH6645484.1 hypothetical protein BKA67DRAFT_113495 [Truncatella angustata]